MCVFWDIQYHKGTTIQPGIDVIFEAILVTTSSWYHTNGLYTPYVTVTFCIPTGAGVCQWPSPNQPSWWLLWHYFCEGYHRLPWQPNKSPPQFPGRLYVIIEKQLVFKCCEYEEAFFSPLCICASAYGPLQCPYHCFRIGVSEWVLLLVHIMWLFVIFLETS